MPFLPEKTEKLEKVYLPTTKDLPNEEDRAWVVLDISPLLTGDVSSINAEEVSTEAEAGMAMIANRIREWNFTERNGDLIPINLASVKRMDMQDFGYLQDLVKGNEKPLTDDEKKTSSATSSPSVTDGTPQNIPVSSR